MVDWNRCAPKGALSAWTTGGGDTDPAWLSCDMMLNFNSPGLYAMVTSEGNAKGMAIGILDGSGRAAIRRVWHLPSFTSSSTWVR